MDNYEPAMVVGSTFRKLADTENAANAWGPWDPKKFTVEDSAFGFIKMRNGATIVLESSWALNMLDVREAVTTLCGTKAGGDMNDGLRINGIRNGRQYVFKPSFQAGGAAFFEGHGNESAADREERLWIEAIRNDTDPITLPDQAYCVTRILEGIYTSAKTGEIYHF
jgi:predicted dehydrogenase